MRLLASLGMILALAGCAHGDSQETKGGLDKSVIDQAIRNNLKAVRACYEPELKASGGKLAGRLQTVFRIEADGKVSAAKFTESTLNNTKVEECVLGVIREIQFPKPDGGGTVDVHYPFLLSPAPPKR